MRKRRLLCVQDNKTDFFSKASIKELLEHVKSWYGYCKMLYCGLKIVL